MGFCRDMFIFFAGFSAGWAAIASTAGQVKFVLGFLGISLCFWLLGGMFRKVYKC